MPIKPIYMEIPGSKYTTIQVQMQAACTTRDINNMLCASFTDGNQVINNPHHAAYFAFFIQQLRNGIQQVKSKKENPIQMGYSVHQKTFIASVSFLSDNACFRMIGKMMAEKCFLKNLKPAYQLLSQVDKEFTREHGKEAIEESMHMIQKSVQVCVSSKMPVDKYEGKKDSFGNKVISAKFNDSMGKIDFPSSDAVPTKQIEINPEVYSNYKLNIDNIHEVLKSLILSSLNGQRIDYVVHSGHLQIKYKSMVNSNKEQCIKYIKERLSFTNSNKIKSYSDASPEIRKKMNEKTFNEKMDEKIYKKEMALVQLLSQSGAVPIQLLTTISKSISTIKIDKLQTILDKIKDQLDKLIKDK